jgi:hypothetical protein
MYSLDLNSRFHLSILKTSLVSRGDIRHKPKYKLQGKFTPIPPEHRSWKYFNEKKEKQKYDRRKIKEEREKRRQ